MPIRRHNAAPADEVLHEAQALIDGARRARCGKYHLVNLHEESRRQHELRDDDTSVVRRKTFQAAGKVR